MQLTLLRVAHFRVQLTRNFLTPYLDLKTSAFLALLCATTVISDAAKSFPSFAANSFKQQRVCELGHHLVCTRLHLRFDVLDIVPSCYNDSSLVSGCHQCRRSVDALRSVQHSTLIRDGSHWTNKRYYVTALVFKIEINHRFKLI